MKYFEVLDLWKIENVDCLKTVRSANYKVLVSMKYFEVLDLSKSAEKMENSTSNVWCTKFQLQITPPNLWTKFAVKLKLLY